MNYKIGVVIIEKKMASESEVIIGSLMLPEQANLRGSIHGGEIMKMMDNTAGIVARRHSRETVVTARVDELEFHEPIHIGNLVTCWGRLTFVGKSSMEVKVVVKVEDLTKEEEPKVALTAYFTMVALDEKGKPVIVPQLEFENKEEKLAFEEGEFRYNVYKNKRIKK